MVEISRVGEQDWAHWRDARLTALADSPGAFASTHARERAFDEATWRSRLRGPGPAWMASAAGSVAGIVAGMRAAEGPPHLVSMWVAPGHRGRGLAGLLVAGVVAWARAAGDAELHLWVTVANDSARRTYARAGFVPTGARQPLPSDPDIEEMELALALAL